MKISKIPERPACIMCYTISNRERHRAYPIPGREHDMTTNAKIIVTVYKDEYDGIANLDLRQIARFERVTPHNEECAKFRAREIAENVRCFGTQNVDGYDMADMHFFVSVQDRDGNWIADYSDRVLQAMREKRDGDVDIFDCMSVSGFERVA